ncbi:hypothetical protein APTSU1_000553700 [Apodemus speciosus]|uniref:Secreted protein n=1 Tax=Apodemus speciosus TaxID=105296 RepID=A0ABQ0ETD2_APOSI
MVAPEVLLFLVAYSSGTFWNTRHSRNEIRIVSFTCVLGARSLPHLGSCLNVNPVKGPQADPLGKSCSAHAEERRMLIYLLLASGPRGRETSSKQKRRGKSCEGHTSDPASRPE